MAGTLRSIKLAIHHHLTRARSAGGSSAGPLPTDTFGPASPIPAGNFSEREERSVCKRFCRRAREFRATDQTSSTKHIRTQTLEKNLLESWDHTFCKAILMQPSSSSPVPVLPIQQEEALLLAESQISFPRASSWDRTAISADASRSTSHTARLSQPQLADAGSYHRFGEGHPESPGESPPFSKNKKQHSTQTCAFKPYSLPNNRNSAGSLVLRAESRMATFIFLIQHEGARRSRSNQKPPRNSREVSISTPNLTVLLHPTPASQKFPEGAW